MVKSVDASTASVWLKKNEAVLVDVREPDEYAAMHIAGAMLVPLGTVSLQTLPELQDKKLIIHCQLGRRGGAACEKLLKENPTLDVYNLEGGMVAWQKAGFDIAGEKNTPVSIQRQVQIITGTGVLAGTLLGVAFHPAFLLLPAFFGVGLLFSGITGSCALAALVGKLPWNRQKTNTD